MSSDVYSESITIYEREELLNLTSERAGKGHHSNTDRDEPFTPPPKKKTRQGGIQAKHESGIYNFNRRHWEAPPISSLQSSMLSTWIHTAPSLHIKGNGKDFIFTEYLWTL